MKHEKSLFKRLCALLLAIGFVITFSACAVAGKQDADASIVMIKNASMSTYGTGFAVGVPGEPVDTIVTAYSVIATLNGAPPKSAEVVVDDSRAGRIAEILFYDEARNFAILKLSQPVETLKPVVFKTNVSYKDIIYARGFEGTGNIMSNYESFGTADVVQYRGAISAHEELTSILVYKYSNEFNRAVIGAPAITEKGICIGMCAYSLDSMNTYAQYILSSGELMQMLAKNNIGFMTEEEVMWKNVVFISLIAGAAILALIIILAIILPFKKKEKSGESFEQSDSPVANEKPFLVATSGALSGLKMELESQITIGRDPSKCNVVFPVAEPGISGKHCTIYAEGGNIYIVDSSTYGTFLMNGTKLSRDVPMRISENKFAFYVAEPKNSFEFIVTKEI